MFRTNLNRFALIPACMLSHSVMSDSVTLWTVARQAPLSTRFSRNEYWSGFSCPPPGDLYDPRIEPVSLKSPALSGGFFTISTTWEVLALIFLYIYFWVHICSFLLDISLAARPDCLGHMYFICLALVNNTRSCSKSLVYQRLVLKLSTMECGSLS